MAVAPEADDGIVVHAPGIVSYRTEQGARAIFHHFSEHPERRGGTGWEDRASARYIGGRGGQRWRQEQGMDRTARPGDSMYKTFRFTRNVKPNFHVQPQRDAKGAGTDWFHLVGIDAAPHAAVFACNRPSPTWEHPTKGTVPYLDDGQWVVYSEIFDTQAQIPTDALRLRIYQEAMIYAGLRDWVPLQGQGDQVGYLADIFCDPSALQLRTDLSNHELLPLYLSIGHPLLDARLNDRVKGIEHMNGLFSLQRDCCGLRYYGRTVICERCHVPTPGIPGIIILERCTELVRQIQIAVKPKTKFQEEVTSDTKLARRVPQHLVDGLRYLLMGGSVVVPQLRKRVQERIERRPRSAWEAGSMGEQLALSTSQRQRSSPFADLAGYGDPDA